MQAISPIPRPRRVRRTRTARRATLGAVAVACLIVAVLGAYRVGRSQAEIEIARLAADLAAQRELHRLTTLQLAEVEQQAEAAVARHARLVREQKRREPSAELRRLAALADERLRAGVPSARLEFVLAQATSEPVCAREVESRRVAIRTPASTGPIAAATFFDNRVIVTGEGMALRAADGAPGSDFDPAQPVTLRFLEIGGETATATGPLPLAQALVVEGEELRFAARLSEREPGLIEISAQRCQLP
jgi:hypothetical protein